MTDHLTTAPEGDTQAQYQTTAPVKAEVEDHSDIVKGVWPFPDERPAVSPIKGYRALTHEEVALINEMKNLGESLRGIIEGLHMQPQFDQRWVSIGETHLQQGLMALVRAIARPTTF